MSAWRTYWAICVSRAKGKAHEAEARLERLDGTGHSHRSFGGGAYLGKGYAERHMLAAVLGSGVEAESVQWHWRQAAGCAEDVEIKLSHATDIHDQALQVYAPKLWFVYDQAALLRKRFILPRVVMDDVLISTGNDALVSQAVVDIDFGADVDLGDLVELPSDTTSDTTINSSSPVTDLAADSSLSEAKTTGGSLMLSLPWLVQVQQLCENLTNERTISGQQVAVDADLLNERMQAYFGDYRTQAQRCLTEARDIQQQLAGMDNVLRPPQLTEVVRHLSKLEDQLVRLKRELNQADKRLEEEQKPIRASLLEEKKALIKQADLYRAPAAAEAAAFLLTQLLAQQLSEPTRAAVILADIMRKPMERPMPTRGEELRHSMTSQPALAARSASMRGKLELGSQTWPFQAQGSFEVVQPMLNSAGGQPPAESTARWQLTIQSKPAAWQLAGQLTPGAEACSVKITTPDNIAVSLDCQVSNAQVSGHGQLDFPAMLRSMATGPSEVGMNSQLASSALSVDEQTPQVLRFQSAELKQMANCELDSQSTNWLASRLESSATECVAQSYLQAATQLDSLVVNRLSQQKSTVALLRKDTEQFLSAQHDELRLILAGVTRMIEQQQTSYQFARQPGDIAR